MPLSTIGNRTNGFYFNSSSVWMASVQEHWETYKQRQFKIVTPIMIMGFVIGLFPFRNGKKILVIIMGLTNTSESFLF